MEKWILVKIDVSDPNYDKGRERCCQCPFKRYWHNEAKYYCEYTNDELEVELKPIDTASGKKKTALIYRNDECKASELPLDADDIEFLIGNIPDSVFNKFDENFTQIYDKFYIKSNLIKLKQILERT